MTKSAYMLLGLTAIVAALAAVIAFAILRAFAAARNMVRGGSRQEPGAETAFVAAAMEEAVARLKLREQVLSARVEASERVSDECLRTGRPIRRRQVRIAGDRPTHLGVSVSPITSASGTAHGAICLFSDLTDIFELEERLRLKDSLAQVGELTAGIAHEFRNGLPTIHGYPP